MLVDTDEISQYIYSILTADADNQGLSTNAPGGVWRGLADLNTATPYIVFNQQSGIDTTAANGRHILSNNLYKIQAVGTEGQTNQIVATAGAINHYLGRVTMAASANGHVSCFRAQPIDRDEIVNGFRWSYVGGIYRFYITA